MAAAGKRSGVVVIVVSGPSSSGKSSLARALQRRLGVAAVLVEADRAFPLLPSAHPGWVATREAVVAFHDSVAAWAQRGFHVIVEGSLPYEDPQLRDECLRVFEEFDLRVVGVHCSDAVLTAREATGVEERPRGWAVRQARDIHDGMRYAAEVDKTAASAEECAEEVARRLGLAR